MDATSFRVPVRVHVAGDDLEISTLSEAAEFLRDWPSTRRGPVYACAVRGCDAAFAGLMRVEDARKAFESFARITGILANRRMPAGSVPPARPPVDALALRH
jgi:hypothetical protein